MAGFDVMSLGPWIVVGVGIVLLTIGWFVLRVVLRIQKMMFMGGCGLILLVGLVGLVGVWWFMADS